MEGTGEQTTLSRESWAPSTVYFRPVLVTDGNDSQKSRILTASGPLEPKKLRAISAFVRDDLRRIEDSSGSQTGDEEIMSQIN